MGSLKKVKSYIWTSWNAIIFELYSNFLKLLQRHVLNDLLCQRFVRPFVTFCADNDISSRAQWPGAIYFQELRDFSEPIISIGRFKTMSGPSAAAADGMLPCFVVLSVWTFEFSKMELCRDMNGAALNFYNKLFSSCCWQTAVTFNRTEALTQIYVSIINCITRVSVNDPYVHY